jgi:benzodiazapine receptor
MKNIKIIHHTIARFLPEILGAVLYVGGGMAMGLLIHVGQGSWYMGLHKPSFNPPDWIFGPVWTVLYILLGIALGQIWKNRKKNPLSFLIFIVQMILNFSWSPLFFFAHLPGWALLDLSAMWFLTSLLFISNRKNLFLCGLLLPYFIWISFAWVLNHQIYKLNP